MHAGFSGFSYSRSVSGSYGVYLVFHMTYLTDTTDGHGRGLQLRCLSE
ncbi:hypothetical protein [uncultured Rikenella sp.]|nr:hypothetical protein [uncultured Rikenella sp.]